MYMMTQKSVTSITYCGTPWFITLPDNDSCAGNTVRSFNSTCHTWTPLIWGSLRSATWSAHLRSRLPLPCTHNNQKQLWTCSSGQQSPCCSSLFVFKQDFNPVCIVPIAFLHQSLVWPVTTVSRCHTKFWLIEFNGKLCEVIATLKLCSTINILSHIFLNKLISCNEKRWMGGSQFVSRLT